MHEKIAYRWIVIVFIICNNVWVFGQTDTISNIEIQPEEKITNWQTLLEEIIENSEEEKDIEVWQDLLSDLAENPVSLNNATKESLESIPFLTESQVENLSYYIYRYGPLVSISELLLVDGMDEQTLRWLEPFVILGKAETFPIAMPSMKKALAYGKQEIRIRFGRCLQEKKGYSNTRDSTQEDNSYLGNPNQINIRYGFNYKNKLQWGLVLEKDAGEKLWDKKNKSVDYASFHFLLKDRKRLKTLIIGDYGLRFGQGLICASTFSLGKNTSGATIEQSGANLSRHFSSSESGFFRGVGATFVVKPFVQKTAQTKGSFGLEITGFCSIKKIDTNLSNGLFTTISKSELHRTKSEIAIYNNVDLETFGAHCALRTGKSQIGFTALSYRFSANFNPEWKPYNCFYFRGKQGGNMAMNFRFLTYGIPVFGEIAIDEKRNPACITGISLKPFSNLDLSMLGRSYSRKFNALYGNAFSEGSSVKNEYGMFASCEWRIIRKWRLNAYFDSFCFPWLKYGINKPSSGYEYALLASYKPTSASLICLRFKTKDKAKNENEELNTISNVENNQKNQLRLQASITQESWTLKTVLDGNSIPKTKYKKKINGYAASQEISYSTFNKAFTISVRYALFETEDYDNRIYSYERDLPGAFSMPSFYGKGNRFGLLIKYELSENIGCWLKIGHSVYLDREEVGTNLEQVKENYLTDIRGMIRWKF